MDYANLDDDNLLPIIKNNRQLHILLNNDTINTTTINTTTLHDLTYLHKLILSQNLHIKLFLDTNKDIIDCQTRSGHTALMLACILNQYDTVDLLIKKGANVLLQNKYNETAFTLSLHNYELFKLLVESNTICYDSLLIECCSIKNDSRFIQLLLNKGVNVNSQNIYKMNSLMYLNCEFSNPETIGLLIDYKINLDMQDINGNTALILLCKYGDYSINYECIKLFIKYKANLNLQNNKGKTALMYCCNKLWSNEHFEMAKILIDEGAILNIRDNNNNCALINMILNCKFMDYCILNLHIMVSKFSKYNYYFEEKQLYNFILLKRKHICYQVLNYLIGRLSYHNREKIRKLV